MSIYSTDNVNYQIFRPHGRVNLSILDNEIMIFRALGPFNIDLLTSLYEIELDALQEINSNWVEIVVFEYSCIALEEVFREFTSHLLAQKASGSIPLASAFVFPKEIDGVLLMTSKYKRCFDDAGLLFKHFDNEKQAMAWVKTFI